MQHRPGQEDAYQTDRGSGVPGTGVAEHQQYDDSDQAAERRRRDEQLLDMGPVVLAPAWRRVLSGVIGQSTTSPMRTNTAPIPAMPDSTPRSGLDNRPTSSRTTAPTTREIASRACADVATPRITAKPGSASHEQGAGFGHESLAGQRLPQVELDVVGVLGEVSR